MNPVRIKRAAVGLAAFAVCALTFSSCAGHTRQVLNISKPSGAQSAVTESSEAPVISSKPAAVPVPSKAAMSSEASAAVKKTASSSVGVASFPASHAADEQPIIKGIPCPHTHVFRENKTPVSAESAIAANPLNSMFLLPMTVQWAGHGFYFLDQADDGEAFYGDAAKPAIKSGVGAFLGNYQPDSNSSFPLYAIKGVNPAKMILVQNNRAYLKFDYVFPDTVTYQGHLYRVGGADGKQNGDTIDGKYTICGGRIGMAGPYKAYAVKKITPSKAIFVAMKGTVGKITFTGEKFVFLRIS